MKKFLLKFASFLIVAIVILAAFAPVVRAQNLGGTVRISTVPDGPYYMVDGMNYNHAVSAVWPSGSKHLLSVQSLMQDGVSNKARYTFQNWQAGGVTLPAGNIVTVTADPSLTTITANFQAEYALSLVFNSCTDSIYCSGPGTIYVGGAPYRSNQDIWVGPGSTSVLLAVPNAGYVFSGWEPGPGQAIQGALNTVTVNQPVSVYARFQVARRVNLATVPPGINQTGVASGCRRWQASRKRALPLRGTTANCCSVCISVSIFLFLYLFFFQPPGYLWSKVCNDHVSARPLDAGQRLHGHPALIKPSLLSGSFNHRVFAADVIGRNRQVTMVPYPLNHIQVSQGGLHHHNIGPLFNIKVNFP